MHSEVAHHAVFAVEFHHALPVDRFQGVEVAGVQEPGVGLDDLTELAAFKHRKYGLHGGEKDGFRRAAHQHFRVLFYAGHYFITGLPVDSEGLFAHEVFAGTDNGAIKLGVEVVRHRAVDRLDPGVGQQLPVIVRVLAHRREIFLVPFQHGRVLVAHGDNFRPGGCIHEVAPARGGGGELAPHEAGADYSEFDCFHKYLATKMHKNHKTNFLICSLGDPKLIKSP